MDLSRPSGKDNPAGSSVRFPPAIGHWLAVHFGELTAGALGSVPLVPTAATILTIGCLRFVDNKYFVLGIPTATYLGLFACVLLLAMWGACAILYGLLGLATAQGAMPSNYSDLMSIYQELQAWQIPPRDPGEETEKCDQLREQYIKDCTAYQAFTKHLERIKELLDGKSKRTASGWVSGIAYIELWNHVHRAQEALIGFEPLDLVIQHADYDYLRIRDSTLQDLYQPRLRQCMQVLDLEIHLRPVREQLKRIIQDLNKDLPGIPQARKKTYEDVLDVLNAAQTQLDSTGHVNAVYFGALTSAADALSALAHLPSPDEDPKQLQAKLSSTIGTLRGFNVAFAIQPLPALGYTLAPAPSADLTGTSPLPPRTAEEARAQVRSTRTVINEYRDDRRAGLLRTRGLLNLAMASTGVIVYIILWMAIEAVLKPEAILNAFALYLVGVMVGLFNRLFGTAGTDTSVEDFGLSATRLLTTLVVSGVAAVLGVFLISVVASTLPGVSGAGGTGAPSINTDQMAALVERGFDVLHTPLSVFTAAVFGLTPGLLIDRLTQAADTFKSDLRKSATTE
ncbi:MAG TPA: hypothetical protein VFZ25_05620 [Chloroflexota bacterium]|nr:hypothetical protein [Chloroflexota bacterium]